MQPTDLLNIAVAVLIGAVMLILTVIGLEAIIRARRALQAGNAVTNPQADWIIAALTGYIYKAIAAGERSVLWGFQMLQTEIEGVDKKAVADQIYNLLPDVLPVPVPIIGVVIIPIGTIKRVIPPATFEDLVKTAYDDFDALITRNEVYLKQALQAEVDALAELPGGTPPVVPTGVPTTPPAIPPAATTPDSSGKG